MNTVVVVQGSTAVGKTGIAIELAKHYSTAIISADSRQCYREMNIGTARPTAAEMAEVKHYFAGEFPVTEAITVADFERLALQYLHEIFVDNNIAIVCGGTGLYLKALTEGLDEMPPVDNEIAAATDAEYKAKGLAWLKTTLAEADPEFYRTAEQDNPARLLRALSFLRSTGESILTYRTGTRKERPFTTINLGIHLPRQLLYERINSRVDAMMASGLLREAEVLYPKRQLKNLQTVGYAELFAYMDGMGTLAEALEKIKQHTRNYAKRQETWFKRVAGIRWFDATLPSVVTDITQYIDGHRATATI
ncbi:MAG: tRNA (adenosine(37)-N6)-dimethylallyltransferase MiaA [Chitinophagia bacterium]|nr:tRNA (adenosine(37)-N6)-dimethylallyltransferase MiaA [Chitinophagia bacterium]